MPEEPLTMAGFEKNLDELEAVVKQLEQGELTLQQALELFERGSVLSETCRKQLEQAESRVEILTRRGNQMRAEPFKTE